MKRRVLLVGATGAFGSRLAEHLARWPCLHLILAARRPVILAARRPAPLDRLRARLAADAVASLETALFDRGRPDLAALSPWLVVDAAGPFQGGDYALARAAVEAAAHDVDLADTRTFVAGFADALDGPARAGGLLAVTGASSTPALSQAVLRPLVAGWQRLDRVIATIAPGSAVPPAGSVCCLPIAAGAHPRRRSRPAFPGWRVLLLGGSCPSEYRSGTEEGRL